MYGFPNLYALIVNTKAITAVSPTSININKVISKLYDHERNIKIGYFI